MTLDYDKWYYLALTYGDETQSVYLNGDLLRTEKGPLHQEWQHLRFHQLGTGCISGDVSDKPVADFCGWYGFHGVIDEFRLWSTVLSHHEIVQLTEGRRIKAPLQYSHWCLSPTILLGTESSCWSIKLLVTNLQGTASLVRCS